MAKKAEKQETKDGLPVTEMTADEFAQKIKDGEKVEGPPPDPLDVQIPPMELVAELEREIGNLTGNAALGRVSLRAFSANARKVVAQREQETAEAKQAEAEAKKHVRDMQHILTAMKARLEKQPNLTLAQMIEGGNGWSPLPIDHLLQTDSGPDDEGQ